MKSAVALILATPLLVLVGGAVVALCLAVSPSELVRQIHEPAVREAIGLSLRTTLLSLVAVVAFGTPLAILMSRRRGWVASALEVFVTLPAIMPPSVAGLALLLAFGRQGLLGSTLDAWGVTIAFTPFAVILAQVFVATPFYVREASAAFQSIDPTVVDAARIDGADPPAVLWRVSIPLILPFLATGAVLAWARALGEFGATILFAGSLQGVTQTLPLAIYVAFATDLEQAKAIAVILLLGAVLVLVLLRLVLGRRLAYAH